MPIAGTIVVFFVIWWLVFYMSLPFGVRGQWEAGGAEVGTEPGAPFKPNLRRKMLATTAITAALTAIIWGALEFGLIDLNSDITWDDLEEARTQD